MESALTEWRGQRFITELNSKTMSAKRIFLAGDVMLGRGIDQILAHSCHPNLYEGYVKDARDYVTLAVNRNGDLPSDRGVDYVP